MGDEHGLTAFLWEVLENPGRTWSSAQISKVARFDPPGQLFAGRSDLLRSDIYTLWAKWFVETIVDPAQQRETIRLDDYAFVYDKVLQHIKDVITDVPLDEKRAAARSLARLLQPYLKRHIVHDRLPVERRVRLGLLDAVWPEVRCWVCGYKFAPAAVGRFEHGGQRVCALPQFIDWLKPRGLSAQDSEIEVDHIVPHAAGGGNEENLALACGWCNRSKGAFTGIYDQPLTPLLIRHPRLGIRSAPRPLWVVRLLATRGRCEAPEGCTETTRICEMTVTLKHPNGAANPTNLRVVCKKHDDMQATRFISRDAYSE
jgi:hypothetical protein